MKKIMELLSGTVATVGGVSLLISLMSMADFGIDFFTIIWATVSLVIACAGTLCFVFWSDEWELF